MKQYVKNTEESSQVENLYSESNSEEIIKKELDELITNITENVLGSTTRNSFVKELRNLQLKIEDMNRRLRIFMLFTLAILGVVIYLLSIC